MLSPQPHLNYLHTIFGQVVRGLEVLPQIPQGDTMRVKIGADSMATFILTAPDGKRPGAIASLGGPELHF
jgi:cyclophilin family peptidyl-prolyl cis-trans isomerase